MNVQILRTNITFTNTVVDIKDASFLHTTISLFYLIINHIYMYV